MNRICRNRVCVAGACLLFAAALAAEEKVYISRENREGVKPVIRDGSFVIEVVYRGQRTPGMVTETVHLISEEKGEFTTPQVTYGTLIKAAEVKTDPKGGAISVTFSFRPIGASQIEKAARAELPAMEDKGRKEARKKIREMREQQARSKQFALDREEIDLVKFGELKEIRIRIKNSLDFLGRQGRKPPEKEEELRKFLSDLIIDEKREMKVQSLMREYLKKNGCEAGRDSDLEALYEECYAKAEIAKKLKDLGATSSLAGKSLEETCKEYIRVTTRGAIISLLKDLGADTTGERLLERALAIEDYFYGRPGPGRTGEAVRPEAIGETKSGEGHASAYPVADKDMEFINAQGKYAVETTFKPEGGAENDPNSSWDAAEEAGDLSASGKITIVGHLAAKKGDAVDWWLLKGVQAEDLRVEPTLPEKVTFQKVLRQDDTSAVWLRVKASPGVDAGYTIGCRSAKGSKTGDRKVVENEHPVLGKFPF